MGDYGTLCDPTILGVHVAEDDHGGSQENRGKGKQIDYFYAF